MTDRIILYTNPNDPLIAAAATASDIPAIHVDELVPFITRAEWPRVIDLDYPARIIALFSGREVINRVFTFHQTGLMEVIRAWKYHELWAHIAIRPLIDSGIRTVHDPGTRGVSRSLMPLNSQWQLVSTSELSFAVPTFVYAFGGELPDLADFTNPMQKSVWSLFDWRQENNLPESERNWHRFYVEKPVGTPIICYFADVERLGARGLGFLFPRERVPVDVDGMVCACRTISGLFRSLIGEILLFLGPDSTLTFLAFSPSMESALETPEGKKLVSDWLCEKASHATASSPNLVDRIAIPS